MVEVGKAHYSLHRHATVLGSCSQGLPIVFIPRALTRSPNSYPWLLAVFTWTTVPARIFFRPLLQWWFALVYRTPWPTCNFHEGYRCWKWWKHSSIPLGNRFLKIPSAKVNSFITVCLISWGCSHALLFGWLQWTCLQWFHSVASRLHCRPGGAN